MELLLLVGAIVILGIWVGWQEYRLTNIREELDCNSNLLDVHKNCVSHRLGAIERKLRVKENQERIAHRKAELKEYLDVDDDMADKIYAIAIGLQEPVNKCKQNEEEA